MSQPLGESAPTRLTGTGDVVHLALWSPLLNRTRCGVTFDGAGQVHEPVSCMTCLVRADILEIPVVGPPRTDAFGDLVHLKWVSGMPFDHMTECCAAECPCDWHKTKELP